MVRQLLASMLAVSVSLAASSAWPAPAEDGAREGSGSPAAAQRAAERRRTFVGVVGFVAFVLGCVGFYMVRQNRKRRQAAAPPPPAKPSPRGPEPEVRARVPTVMICPTCREEYLAEARYCKLDGNRLVEVHEGVELRGPTGGVCPTCGHGFDPGVSLCPTHGDELIPWALHPRDPTEDGPKKICPVCGSQYSPGSGFCGADGAALEVLN